MVDLKKRIRKIGLSSEFLNPSSFPELILPGQASLIVMEKKVASFLDLLVGWLFFVCFYADVQDWKASMMKILLAGCAAERSLRGGSLFGENFALPVMNILSSDPCVHGRVGWGPINGSRNMSVTCSW